MTETRQTTDAARDGQLTQEEVRERMQVSAASPEPQPVGIYQQANAPHGARMGLVWWLVLLVIIVALVFFAYQAWA